MKRFSLAVMIGLASFNSVARAGFEATTTGSGRWLSDAPAMVDHSSPNANWVVQGWYEGTTTLSNDLAVNHDGSQGFFGDLLGRFGDDPTSGVLPTGTTVNSYMLHFNPVTDAGVAIFAGFTFPTEILGLIFLSGDLATTDWLAPDIDYQLDASWRGLELENGLAYGNVLGVSADRRHLNMKYSAVVGGQVDQVRVLTLGALGQGNNHAVVPEPASIVTWLGLALTLFCALGRRHGVDAISRLRCCVFGVVSGAPVR